MVHYPKKSLTGCSLKPRIQAIAHARIYNLFKALRTKDPQVLVKAYKTYVRPVVENGTAVFNPFLKKDIARLENVQNNFTRKLVLRCSGLPYSDIPNGVERRQRLDLPSLKSRRDKYDLLLAFKILHGITSVSSKMFFTLAQSRTRGGARKLATRASRTNVRSKFFSVRVVSAFNSLIAQGCLGLKLSTFKNLLKKLVIPR